MTSSGSTASLMCDTEEPGFCTAGAYISTCPLAWRPAVRPPLLATTAVPTQWRSPVFVLAVTRSASVIAG
jgi:hypothetical protein